MGTYISSLKVDYQRTQRDYKLILQDIAGEVAGKIGTSFSSGTRGVSATFTRDRYCPEDGVHTMLVARVLLGKVYWADLLMSIHKAPTGFDSVGALTRSEGGSVDHREFAIFKEAQTLPLCVIRYSHSISCQCQLCTRGKQWRGDRR